MVKRVDIQKFFVYRWRFVIGYVAVGLILAAGLVFSSMYIPGGISEQEMRAVVTSDSVSPSSLLGDAPLNAPYYLLQKVSLMLFGVTLLGIKLPSLIFGVLTAIAMVVLLRKWFRPSIALLAAVIAVATGQFIFLAQSGSVGILYLFWPVALLLFGTLISKRVKLGLIWKVLFFATAALSLYTPLSIYVIVALLSATILHPHLRYIVKRLSKWKLALGLLFGGAIITPLIWTIVRDPAFGLQLLGVPTEMPNILENLSKLAAQYFGFMTAGNGTVLLPVFGLGSMLIIMYGAYRLIRTRETVQSYIILAWLACLLPILLLNPQYTSITFVPLLLLLATGLEGILGTWYKLFPRNPYARVAGLVPIIILTVSLVVFGLERYAYSYTYASTTVNNFSRDIRLLPETTKVLRVAPHEVAFYNVVAKHRPELTVTTTTPDSAYTATRAAKQSTRPVSQIIVDRTASEADRFYLYEK